MVEREGTSMSELGKLGLRMRSCVPGVGAAANLGKGRRLWEGRGRQVTVPDSACSEARERARWTA